MMLECSYSINTRKKSALLFQNGLSLRKGALLLMGFCTTWVGEFNSVYLPWTGKFSPYNHHQLVH
jgi:hypothetical protein